MSNISASDVAKLRKTTGAGMMDCKKALMESNGDFDEAIQVLRKKGQKIAAKRADRLSSEGVVLIEIAQSGETGVLVSLNCETDFVAKNDDYIGLAKQITQIALNCNTLDELHAASIGDMTVEQKLTEQTGVIGEKIEIGAFERLDAPAVGGYVHTGNKMASLVSFSKNVADAGLKKSLAMQVVAMNPLAVNEEGLSQEVIEKELEVAKEQIRQEGKPENMVEKIAQGKINKFLKENTLVNQEFIEQGKTIVKDYVSSIDKDLSILNFKRVSIV